ncbi:histone-like nucleoid-structuring protein MvaT [Pseudomonas matsuisoli]|uniref:Transcriptional regulator MvaT n=1 Tax=Pseudomonas matsuisoli TaxID=1515666 RepID=A0A917USS4_9PSED|nr:histone-like nucleoid-structuring protein MvaT [Pseudomonas matsuisoli]GGJ82424.1 transcriptional regulator MvaT [Pseudomonas matsuisoli]
MSRLNEFRATEEAIKELQERLNRLTQDDGLKRELEFEGKLRALMDEHEKSLRDIIALLDPSGSSKTPRSAASPAAAKRARKIKQYKNPHSGEVIETKGGNHKALKEWKSQWGNETVESWATLLD